jgi:UPF0755 protein
MKKVFWWRIFSLVLVTGACAGAASWLWQGMQSVLERRIVLHERSELFEIERGTSLAEIARRMENLGWLGNDLYLKLEARRLNVGANLKAGLYEVYDGTTPRKLLQKIVSGDVKVFQITFIEGSTFTEMRDVLEGHKHLIHTIEEEDDAWVMAQIASSFERPEGRFFPSTYNFSHGDSDLDILRRAYQRMVELLAFHWESREPDLPYESPDDALIMASIIEKETGRADERAQIAGVFVRRLRLGMKLQTDPTVIYGIGKNFDGNLRRVDLETDTEYNTYTRYGLPPTPIAMPGAASISAGLHPAPGKFLYFVGKGDGSHAFSTSLAEHNAAVRRFQLPGRSLQQ